MPKSFMWTVAAGVVSGLVVTIITQRLSTPETAPAGGNNNQGVWV